MTERNASRELAIALHLAKVMGIETWEVRMPPRRAPITKHHFTRDGETHEWEPHHDRAQWAECVEWAAVNGYGPTLEDTYCAAFNDQVKQFKASHDNTPAGIRAAALEAIALATGWPGMEGE